MILNVFISQEVLGNTSSSLRLRISGGRVVLVGIQIQSVIYLDYRRLIPAAIAVVGSREYRYAFVLMAILVSFHHQLVGPANHF